jgi:myosin heavy subunit
MEQQYGSSYHGWYNVGKGVNQMTKKEAVLIALKHLFAFVDSAEVWEDNDYQDFVEALKKFGITEKTRTITIDMIKI